MNKITFLNERVVIMGFPNEKPTVLKKGTIGTVIKRDGDIVHFKTLRGIYELPKESVKGEAA